MIKNDCLIGVKLLPENIKPMVDTTIEYYDESVGTVRVTVPAYDELIKRSYERHLIAGITRYAYICKTECPLINTEFINGGYKKLNPPTDFKEKAFIFLKYLFEHGGRENLKFDFSAPAKWCALAYASIEEFGRIVQYLEKQGWLNISKTHPLREDLKIFMGVELTILGMEEVEKTLPKIPLIGLVEQKITTGDLETDEKINHAKNLFFKSTSTFDDKRSACEALSYVLEPLREDLKTFFSSADVSDFFQLVNRFDIRHNKATTISLAHEEQIEWVFYTLLNTITIYVKLKNKHI